MPRIIKMVVLTSTSLPDDKIRDIMADFVDKLVMTEGIEEVIDDLFEEVNN
jgi:hypothetical protein